MSERAVDMMAGTSLIAEVVQRSGLDPVRHHLFDRVGGISDRLGEAPGIPDAVPTFPLLN